MADLLSGFCMRGTHHHHDLAMKLAVCITFPISIANQANDGEIKPITSTGTSSLARYFGDMLGIRQNRFLHITHHWSGSLRQLYFKGFSSILHAVTKWNEMRGGRASSQQWEEPQLGTRHLMNKSLWLTPYLPNPDDQYWIVSHFIENITRMKRSMTLSILDFVPFVTPHGWNARCRMHEASLSARMESI